MAKVKYVSGDSGAEESSAFGYDFQDGKSVDVKDEDVGKFAGNPYFEVAGEKSAAPKQQAPKPVEPATEPQGPFTVKDEGSGWFAILDAKGEQVGNKVREADAKAFEEMSDAEQVEYLK